MQVGNPFAADVATDAAAAAPILSGFAKRSCCGYPAAAAEEILRVIFMYATMTRVPVMTQVMG